ncbi:MAG TPA: hypothetical protein DCM08_06395 [Microscillaceae bacterium]|nr:hypothetical protein [Microscillaceae bacterium]
MKIKSTWVCFFSGLLIFLDGLYSYAVAGAFVPIPVGLLLMAVAFGMKNKHLAHFVVLFTLLFGIASLFTGVRAQLNPTFTEAEKLRKLFTYGILVVTCLGATGLYVLDFIQKRKERLAAVPN